MEFAVRPASAARPRNRGARRRRARPRARRGRARASLIGRDTRESGAGIEARAGPRLSKPAARRRDSVGVVPTPAVAYLDQDRRLRPRRRDLGLAQSLSRQRHQGVLGSRRKVLRRRRSARSKRLVADAVVAGAAGGAATPARPRRRSVAHYVAHLRQILAAAGPLAGTPIVSTAPTAPPARSRRALPRRSASRSMRSASTPDGRNINLGCGSTAMEPLQARWSAAGARLGVAFDGDGDRALFVDHRGRRVDGDAVMLICADLLRARGALRRRRHRGHGDEQHRPRAGAAGRAASRSCAARSATST